MPQMSTTSQGYDDIYITRRAGDRGTLPSARRPWCGPSVEPLADKISRIIFFVGVRSGPVGGSVKGELINCCRLRYRPKGVRFVEHRVSLSGRGGPRSTAFRSKWALTTRERATKLPGQLSGLVCSQKSHRTATPAGRGRAGTIGNLRQSLRIWPLQTYWSILFV
jgi:hypothetical protein